jgi:3-methyladenine DNA glycosylase/8-oxoguanine DNA glycosylase
LGRLAPNEIDDAGTSLTTTLALNGAARTVRIVEDPPGSLAVRLWERRRPAREVLAPRTTKALAVALRRMFALDDDLAPFYAAVAADDDLAFATKGIGRMLRSPTVFEDVIRTVCTTNCAWSATIRMIEALVAHLGKAAPGTPQTDWRGHAFPTPEALAEADEKFYKDVVRAGYRGPYFRKLGELVASGAIDLESWFDLPRTELADHELEKRLLALPGVGPYAAAHVMLLRGRRSRLVLDSWTRPYYARLIGKKKVSDKTIARRFKRYGDEAGLAFWLFLWKQRHEAPVAP